LWAFGWVALLAQRLETADDDQATALYRTVLEQINTLVCRSVHIVDDLLDIGRLEAGHSLPLAGSDVELVSLVRDVLQSRAETTNSGRLRLELAQPELWGWGRRQPSRAGPGQPDRECPQVQP
jgi:hypothetical protein